MANEFTVTRESPTGDVPAITYQVRGDTIRAEMANGAKLYAEGGRRDGGADVRITAGDGATIAEIVVYDRPGINLTESVADVGSALLWSHWRLVEADKRSCDERDRKKPIAELIAKSSFGAGLADIKERGIDAHLADVEKGKF